MINVSGMETNGLVRQEREHLHLLHVIGHEFRPFALTVCCNLSNKVLSNLKS